MTDNCQFFINSKNRNCLKKHIKNEIYCKIHKKLVDEIKNNEDNQTGGGNGQAIDEFRSPYSLVSSKLAPNSRHQSWYHYQAPAYQNFGDYVCIKKSYLNTTRNLLHDILGPIKIQ